MSDHRARMKQAFSERKSQKRTQKKMPKNAALILIIVALAIIFKLMTQ